MSNFEEKFWSLLEVEGLDLVTAPACRADRGEKFSLRDEFLEEEVMLMAVRELLDRLKGEQVASQRLHIAYDHLRTEHATAQGRLALAHTRVSHAAVTHKDAGLADLARNVLRGEPKYAALTRIPSAARVLRGGDDP